MQARFLAYVSVAAVITLILLFGSQYAQSSTEVSWIPDWRNHQDEGQRSQADKATADAELLETAVNRTYSTLPEMVLVLATLSYTNNSWVEEELGDLLGANGNLFTAFYVVNDKSARLHTPANKGHEAMAYLTYLIDFYDTLPDISVFMHGHATAWHNNPLLDMSSSLLVRHLNREKVMREGYMNLRCHWGPGCPDHLHPQETKFDSKKQEEVQIKAVWEKLFPLTPVPEVLSQPCCSQFAVSRAAIHKMSKDRYIEMRDWLLKTSLTDYITGRIFEYIWQYVFNDTPVFCPDPRICYCDGFGVCFENPDEYSAFFREVARFEQYAKELEAYPDSRHAEDSKPEADGGDTGVAEGSPKARVAWLEEQVRSISQDLARRKTEAFEAGRDPGRRLRAIENARERNATMENLGD